MISSRNIKQAGQVALMGEKRNHLEGIRVDVRLIYSICKKSMWGGSNPGGNEIFLPFRRALGPTQPPVKWVPVLSRG